MGIAIAGFHIEILRDEILQLGLEAKPDALVRIDDLVGVVDPADDGELLVINFVVEGGGIEAQAIVPGLLS